MSAHAKTDSQLWDELPLVERVAAEIYNSKSKSPEPMTAERWLRVKARFATSARICMAEAQEMIDDGEFDE